MRENFRKKMESKLIWKDNSMIGIFRFAFLLFILTTMLGCKTPSERLLVAIETKDMELLDGALKDKADPSVPIDEKSNDGSIRKNYPITHATEHNNLPAVKRLLAAGAKPVEGAVFTAIYRDNLDIFKEFVSAGWKLSDEMTNVVKYKAVKIAKYLLPSTTMSKDQLTSLLQYTDNLEIIKLLVQKGADANGKSSEGIPLLLATKDFDIIRYYLENGADASVTDRGGTTIVHKLASAFYDTGYGEALALIRLAVKKGAKLDARDGWKRTPLDVCKDTYNEANKSQNERISNYANSPTSYSDGSGLMSDIDSLEKNKDRLKKLEAFFKNPKS